jgi:hypothetical protein
MASTDLDLRRARAAKNQSVFRAVNERIEDISESFDVTMLDLLCECAHETCVERLELTRGEYDAVRRVPTHFILKPGHEIADVEQVVESSDRYLVVAKIGAAGEIAMKLDPRK